MAILVGSEKARFEVHQDRLCEESTFFKAAFTSNYKESSEKSIQLPEDDVDTVEMFVQWLYNHHQCSLFRGPWDEDGEYLTPSIRLLVFADKYDIRRLKIHVFEELIAHYDDQEAQCFSQTAMEYVYKNSCHGSGIRTLVAEWYTTCLDKEEFEDPKRQQ